MSEIFDLKRYLGLPVLASEHGADVDKLIIWVHWLMVVLFIGWMGYFLYTLVRFRQSRQAKADHEGVRSHASTWIEGGVALFEAFLLIGLAIPLWAKVVDDFPKESESTVIRVVAEQFSWNSRYPGKDGVFGRQDPKLLSTSNKFGYDPEDPAGNDDLVPPNKDIRVPVGKPVIIHLSSLDVIHSFAVHPLRTTQDAIPGMSIATHFKPTKEGRYHITCAQLCGNGHYSMNGFFTVLSQGEFDEWANSLSKAGAAPVTFE